MELRALLSTLRSGAPGQWSQNLLELSRHFTGSAFLAINTLCTQASGSSWEVYERVDDPAVPEGKQRLHWQDPIHSFFETPNGQDTFHDLLYQRVQQLSLTGVSLLWTPHVSRGTGVDLEEQYSIPSATAWPLPPNNQYPRGAYRVIPYPYGLFGAPVGQISSGAIIPAEQISKVKNHHPILRYDGWAVLSAMSMHVDTIEAIDKARFYAQKSGCDQTLGIELDKDAYNPDDADLVRIRNQLQGLYMGPENAGKLFISPPGATLKQLSTSPRDMAWQEGWLQILDFVLAGYGVPQTVAGLQQSSNYATLYASLRAFSYLSLGPILGRFVGGWTKQVIQPTWGQQFGLTINPPEFKDETLEEQKINNDLKAGIRLNSEMRKLRKLDHLDETKYPWVTERAMQATLKGDVGAPPEGRDSGGEEDPSVNNGRPQNNPKAYERNGHVMREELLAALEKGKTNGTLKPIKG